MRTYKYDILETIQARWSPRAFSPETINEEDLYAILEAASFAPSAYNEQPWRFIIGQGENLETMQSLLMDRNLLWAKKAPVLILLLCKKSYSHNQKSNVYSEFDSGTAWGFMSLEATKRGLYTHAMAGFKKKVARALFSFSEDFEPLIMIALGKPGDVKELDQMFQDTEKSNTRKPVNELILDLWSGK